MPKFSQLDEEKRVENHAYISQRWIQLHELEKEWAEKAIRYLFLTNSGGAIATLSFLGSSSSTLNLLGTKVALIIFVLGVFLVGVLTARTLHGLSELYRGWKADVTQYYDDQFEWEELNARDENRGGDDTAEYILGYASFGCFIFGSVIGFFSFF